MGNIGIRYTMREQSVILFKLIDSRTVYATPAIKSPIPAKSNTTVSVINNPSGRVIY